jgi:hypothetical protein
MLMTPIRMMLLRLYALTLGRFAVCERLVRRILVYWLISRRPRDRRYVAASSYFDVDDLSSR